jgi:hypothetical protein
MHIPLEAGRPFIGQVIKDFTERRNTTIPCLIGNLTECLIRLQYHLNTFYYSQRLQVLYKRHIQDICKKPGQSTRTQIKLMTDRFQCQLLIKVLRYIL